MSNPNTSFYQRLVAHDVIEHLRHLWENEGWSIREADGKLHLLNPKPLPETPWNYVKLEWRIDCHTWSHIMFEVLCKRLPRNLVFVPSGCQECFKVVVKPRTLKELFALEALQIKLDAPAKCGIEERPRVPANYGGYFYTRGIAEGLARLEQVRGAVKNFTATGPDGIELKFEPKLPVFLKRGCTEMEDEAGPSDKWQVTDAQRYLESDIYKWVAIDNVRHKPVELVVNHTHVKWIKFAWSRGDMTAKEFNGGQPLYPEYMTYEPRPVEVKPPEPEEMPQEEHELKQDEQIEMTMTGPNGEVLFRHEARRCSCKEDCHTIFIVEAPDQIYAPGHEPWAEDSVSTTHGDELAKINITEMGDEEEQFIEARNSITEMADAEKQFIELTNHELCAMANTNAQNTEEK
jgi:hypothetical protein